eukprot:sb/3477336/
MTMRKRGGARLLAANDLSAPTSAAKPYACRCGAAWQRLAEARFKLFKILQPTHLKWGKYEVIAYDELHLWRHGPISESNGIWRRQTDELHELLMRCVSFLKDDPTSPPS